MSKFRDRSHPREIAKPIFDSLVSDVKLRDRVLSQDSLETHFGCLGLGLVGWCLGVVLVDWCLGVGLVG